MPPAVPGLMQYGDLHSPRRVHRIAPPASPSWHCARLVAALVTIARGRTGARPRPVVGCCFAHRRRRARQPTLADAAEPAMSEHFAAVRRDSSRERKPVTMSMTGWAARPGSAVLPTCSSPTSAGLCGLKGLALSRTGSGHSRRWSARTGRSTAKGLRVPYGNQRRSSVRVHVVCVDPTSRRDRDQRRVLLPPRDAPNCWPAHDRRAARNRLDARGCGELPNPSRARLGLPSASSCLVFACGDGDTGGDCGRSCVLVETG